MGYTDNHKQRAREGFDRQAATYDASYKGFLGRHLRKPFNFILKQLDSFQFHSVLDVGCGTGLLLEQIKTERPDVKISGIDISSGMLKVARQKLGETADLKSGDAEELPWPDSNFDVVITSCVFHHFTRPLKALVEMKRVLKPDGHLLLSDVTAFITS
jgi:ubiquinone/menaquinone biosynthesis C-methylase UbiE